ncbi:MAG TPA: glycosyltransferase family 4 protein [Actinomycetota bacterium]|nr:glycosyltransferase family 4 protein [Actinomycetota bacterium]
MKVGIVCPYDWSFPGGVRSHILGLAAALREVHGVGVEILAPATDPEPDIWRCGGSIGIPANGSVARLSFGPGPRRRVLERLEVGDLDVLHVHEPAIPSLSLLALGAARIPAVGTFHASAERSAGYALARPLLRSRLDRLGVRIAVSAAARQLIGSYFPAPYRLIPNGIPAGRFARAFPDPEVLEYRPCVLFVGRPEPRKGFDVLLAAMEEVRRHLPVTLVTTAAPPDAPVWVRSVGRVPDDRLPGIYAAADVFCAPSLAGESFGIVLVEAMAAGTPVVCSALPGYREAAAGAARFAPAGDPAALSQALLEVLTDEDHSVPDQIVRGQHRAAELDWAAVSGRVVQAYRDAGAR